ncbi:MAG: hypothetical protein RLZZ381_2784 [Cyanobacteriota bacterium]|jgi:hypothetical protein
MSAIFTPGYIQVIERTQTGWFQSKPKSVFNLSNLPFDSLNKEKYYGLTKTQILAELFRRYQGKLGYYLVDLSDREFYYCGLTVQDLQAKLFELGINHRG